MGRNNLSLDFVLGQRIILSNNHPCKDICDELSAPNKREYQPSEKQGVYPKDFLFEGWHPQCFCFVVPILVDEKEIEKMNDALANGEQYEPKGEQITEYPKEFRDFCTNNADKIRKALRRGTAPYFVRNNAEVIENIINPNRKAEAIKKYTGYKTVENGVIVNDSKGASLKALSIEDKTASARIIGKANLSIKEVSFLQNNIHGLSKDINLFNGLSDIDISDIYNDGTLMSWHKGKLGISNIRYAMDNGESFCPSRDLLSAFRKLKKGKELTFNEEYAIEALFHESVHSQAIGNYIIQSYSIDNKIMETCVQLYARQNYVRILEHYGVKPINFEAIKLGGYG